MVYLLLLLLIVGLVALVVYLLLRRGASRRQHSGSVKTDAPRDPFADLSDTNGDPRALKAGDMVDYMGERSWVRGSLRLSEGGFSWAEHFMDIGDQKCWLSVEEDPDLRMFLWSPLPESELTPHSSKVELNGTTYRLLERGSASYRSEGTTGLREQGGMDYADYEASDGTRLSFERYDHGRWEPALGAPVTPGSITIYPGS